MTVEELVVVEDFIVHTHSNGYGSLNGQLSKGSEDPFPM